MDNGSYQEVQQGESAMTIAAKHGLEVATLWDHPNNAELKNKRKDPNVLNPGDRIFVPGITGNEVEVANEQTHTFEVKSLKTKLKLVLEENDKKLSHVKYLLKVDNTRIEGRTKGDGSLEHPVPVMATSAELVLDPGGPKERIYAIQLASLDPAEEVSGAQQRLKNLGFAVESVTNQLDEATAAALKDFQKKHSLSESGRLDSATVDKLKQVYGC